MKNNLKYLISHRGNTNGRFKVLENKPDYIDNAIKEGFDVEIDVWCKENMIFLGHDKPDYMVDLIWLEDRISKLWIHCKNIESVEFFTKIEHNFNFFWHETDTLTLTSHKHIWVYPGKQPIKNSIAVKPELFDENISFCIGICSDYIKKYIN